jgi:wyosine [tRNA(Phe)-imidazoG37] synthetase (radical SAM superfamily)
MDDNASAVSGKAPAWRQHERRWRDNRYAYAVVSRRSRGVSVGINLNPRKACNFNCIYCQVDRHEKAAIHKVDLDRLGGEIDRVLAAERDGSLYSAAPFDLLRPEERGVRDIAFSGNGEPTAFRRFGDAVRIAVDARRRFGLDSTRIVLITNAAYLKRASLQPALRLLDENNGQIWAKLDAGSEEYFRLVNRSKASLSTILDNILHAARTRPVVIQSLWFRLHGGYPPEHEFETFCGRLRALLDAGGQIEGVQLYTIARSPAESCVTALSNEEVDRLADLLRAHVPVPVETYYGA